MPLARFITTLLLSLLLSGSVLGDSWATHKNERFGYQVSVPRGLTVVSRAADGSGVTWQTGTVRVQVSGTNNPYKIKPHEWFASVRSAAGDKILDERTGEFSGGYWQEIFFLKKSRRVHRKTYIGAGSVNTIEFSYAYRHRDAKYPLGLRAVANFKPGDLTKNH